MPVQNAVEIPAEVLDYLRLHHIITLGTASFTGMPHAATIAYTSDANGIYFSMQPEEMTLRNIQANHVVPELRRADCHGRPQPPRAGDDDGPPAPARLSCRLATGCARRRSCPRRS